MVCYIYANLEILKSSLSFAHKCLFYHPKSVCAIEMKDTTSAMWKQ